MCGNWVGLLRYNFSHMSHVSISFAHSPKNTHISPKNYFGPSQIFNIGPTQIFLILLPKLGPHKYFSYHYQDWATKLYHLYERPYSFILWAKPKKPNKFITTTWHSLQNSLLDGTYYKICYYMTPITKPTATQHPLQSSLLHGTY